MPLTEEVEPASEKKTNVLPVGPTRSIERSCGRLSVSPFKSTVTLLIVPDSPETKMFDGYGVATALSLRVTPESELQNWLPLTVVWLLAVWIRVPMLVPKLDVPL